MKKLIGALLALLLMSGGVVFAERPGTIQIWIEYPKQVVDSDFAGFNIYNEDGVKVGSFLVAPSEIPMTNMPVPPDGDIGNANVYLEGPTVIKTGEDEKLTVTAVDDDGNESSHSKPFLAITHPAPVTMETIKAVVK